MLVKECLWLDLDMHLRQHPSLGTPQRWAVLRLIFFHFQDVFWNGRYLFTRSLLKSNCWYNGVSWFMTCVIDISKVYIRRKYRNTIKLVNSKYTTLCCTLADCWRYIYTSLYCGISLYYYIFCNYVSYEPRGEENNVELRG